MQQSGGRAEQRRHPWSLAGRTEELTGVTGLLVGGGTGVLVTGSEGVGKSRLLEEAVDRLDGAGLCLIRLTATPGSALLPLGSLAQLLPAGSTSTGLPILPVLRSTIAEQARGRRAVLVLDDIEHLDDASAVLVNQLVTNGDVGLVATQTTGTIAPEPIARMWQDGIIERLELPPLDPPRIAQLTEAIAGSPFDELSLDLLWSVAEGNALFVRELLFAARESGDLEIVDGTAHIRRLPVHSPRLADFVRQRVGDLDAAAAAALLIVAVGEPLGPGEVPPSVTPDQLARLDAAGLITTTLDGRRVVIRLVHSLFGQVIQAGASALQLQQAHRDLALAVSERSARRRSDPLRLAHWSVAGQVGVEHSLVLDAARTARFTQELDLARDLAERAWEQSPDFETGELLADLYYELGDTAAAAALRPSWAATARTDDERVRVDINEAITAFWKLRDPDAATVALDRTETAEPSPWKDEAAAVRAVLLASAGRAEEAIAIAETLVDRDPDRVLIQAAMALTHAYRTLGRSDDAVAVCDRALGTYAVLGDQIALITIRILGVGRTLALAESGRLAEAELHAREGMQLCRTEGETGAIGLAALVEGWVRFTQGRLDGAIQALRLSESSFDEVGHVAMRQWALTALTLALATTGDGEAAEAVERSLEEHQIDMFRGATSRARAWTAVANDDPQRARVLLVEAVADLSAAGDVNGELGCLHDLARLGGATDCLERMNELAAICQGSLAEAMALHVAALASRTASDFAAAADALARTGAMLCAAEAAYGAAEAARREGDPRLAAQWSRRASEWRGACEAASTPGLVADLAPVPLTRREREVAILASRGLAAREIGERLFVSRRTVESHLARIYGKLGISSRRELAKLLGDDAT